MPKLKCNTPEEMVNWLDHLFAYKYAERFAECKSVLDIGCNTGYGTHELSIKAHDTVGIDIWKKGIKQCHLEQGTRCSFLTASGSRLPFKDGSFSLVVSFQVIEHIRPNEVPKYLREIKRVLEKNGIFVVSTPNKKLRLLPFQRPWNPDHEKEYDAKELENLLRQIFRKVKILGLFATKDVYLVEYSRVKQNPLTVYLLSPLISVAERILPSDFVMSKKVMHRKRIDAIPRVSKIAFEKFSTKDFQTSEKDLRSCIDIFGLCEK